jgi:hypothetical protein
VGACGALLAITGSYVYLAALSTGSRLLIYLGCCLAALRRAPGAATPASAAAQGDAGVDAAGATAGARATARRAIVPSITAAAIGVLLLMLEPREVVSGMIGIGAGLGLYFLARRGRRALTTQEASS